MGNFNNILKIQQTTAPVFQQQPFIYTGYSGHQMYYQPQEVQMTQQQPLNHQIAYAGQQQQAVSKPYPVQPTTFANQPEIVKVDLEVIKDDQS